MTDVYNQCERCGAVLNTPTARFCSRRCARVTTHVRESPEKAQAMNRAAFGLQMTACGKTIEGTTHPDHQDRVIPYHLITNAGPSCKTCQKALAARLKVKP